MMRYRLYIVYFLPFLFQAQIKFTHYKTDQGLPHDFTFQIYQDTDGYLWIGTDDGLAKFNGSDFKVLDRNDGFRSNFVIDIKKYRQDTLAIATWKGGLHFMKNDSVLIPAIKKDSVSKINTVFIMGDDIFSSDYGRHIIYERKKGLQFKKTSFEIYINDQGDVSLKNKQNKLPSNNIAKTVGDSLYFFRGIYFQNNRKYLKGIYTYVSKEEVTPVFSFFQREYINDFGTYTENTFYATIKDRFYIFNKDSIIKEKQYPFKNNIIHQYAKTSYCEVFIVRDKVTGNDHIYIYDTNKNTWEDLVDRIKSKILISDVFVDRDENIWITSKADGLYQLSQDKGIFSEIVFNKEHIQDIAVTNENIIFFLTFSKLYAYDKKTRKRSMRLFDDNSYQFANNIIEDQKILVIPIDAPEKKTVDFLEYEIHVGGEHRYKNYNKIFLYSTNCISYDNPGRGIQQKTCVRDTNENATILGDPAVVENELWVPTNLGILIYDLDSLKFKQIFKDSDLKQLAILKLQYAPDRGIWIRTEDGLALIEKDKGINYYTEKNGIQSTKINDIFLDHRGVLWIATQKGFSMYRHEMFYNFDKEDGLPSSFVSKITEDKDHQIWVAGNKGVVRIDNSTPFTPITPPKIIVDQTGDQFIVDVIDYSGKKISTQYRAHTNEAWKPFINKVLDIKNYGFGDYNIQFRSRNPSSSWAYSAIHSFSKQLTWYKKPWFILMLSILSTTFISSLIFFQLRKARMRNILLQDTIAQSTRLEQELSTVRENVAQDFHDELGNKLAGITVMSELMMKDEELRQSKSIDMISQVRKDAKDLYFGIKDFVWSIDSRSDDLRELMIYLTDFGEELFQNKGVIFKTKNSLDKEHVKLPYYWSRQLLLLFKEAMTNSLKHAGAKEVILAFHIQKNTLKIIFSDNGKGFNIDTLKRKNGLINMTKRAQKIGGTLEVGSENGTKIVFTGKIR